MLLQHALAWQCLVLGTAASADPSQTSSSVKAAETQASFAFEPCDSRSGACQGDYTDFADVDVALSLMQRTMSVSQATRTHGQSAQTGQIQPTALSISHAHGTGCAANDTHCSETMHGKGWAEITAALSAPFIDPGSLNWAQLALLTLVYGCILDWASSLISDGCEGLLFFPSVTGIVGTVVRPFLEAVPVAVLVLFSGMGPAAQPQLLIGMGALAGSTAMLITLPWFAAVMYGSVPIGAGGDANYDDSKKPLAGILQSGITYGDEVCQNAKVMMLSSLLFLVIEIPSWRVDTLRIPMARQAAEESSALLTGAIVCGICFLGYIWYCYSHSRQIEVHEDKKLHVLMEAISRREVTLGGLLMNHMDDDPTTLAKILRPFYKQYASKHGVIGFSDFTLVLHDLGENVTQTAARAIFKDMDLKHTDTIDFPEFCRCIKLYMVDPKRHAKLMNLTPEARRMPHYDIEEEEEEEVPEGIGHAKKARSMLFNSCLSVFVGLVLVSYFTDPIVGVLSSWGSRSGVSPFYISFVLTPFAYHSSAFRVVASSASKKTSRSITMALSTLIGAACINNTYTLGFLYALMYARGLAWKFRAETLSVVVVQWLLGLIAVSSRTERQYKAWFILALYPLCLMVMISLEVSLGWD